jgi:hypothetical protein
MDTDNITGHILVFGGCGFLGHHIVSRLLSSPTKNHTSRIYPVRQFDHSPSCPRRCCTVLRQSHYRCTVQPSIDGLLDGALEGEISRWYHWKFYSQMDSRPCQFCTVGVERQKLALLLGTTCHTSNELHAHLRIESSRDYGRAQDWCCTTVSHPRYPFSRGYCLVRYISIS